MADIDLGFNTWRRDEHLLLNGIDAPQTRGAEKARGRVSAEALRRRVEGRRLIICTFKDKTGSFGRYLVEIYDREASINDWMVEESHAIRDR